MSHKIYIYILLTRFYLQFLPSPNTTVLEMYCFVLIFFKNTLAKALSNTLCSEACSQLIHLRWGCYLTIFKSSFSVLLQLIFDFKVLQKPLKSLYCGGCFYGQKLLKYKGLRSRFNPNDSIQFPVSLSPPSPTHAFLTRQNFTNTSPCFPLRLQGRPIFARK